MNAFSRAPILTTDRDGTPIVRVPLARGRGIAVMLAEDFDTLTALGISPRYSLNRSGPGAAFAYVRCQHPAAASGRRNTLSVARFIMEAPAGKAVRYHDGDRQNLRPSNLYLSDDARAQGREVAVLRRLRERTQ
jgi:hypothetical protein